jgi:uncharacterized membrane protein YeaQ/YmgE (transglycosylase-associated protein family)
MGILAWIVLGLIAGIIAERVTGERTGVILAAVVGIVGALLGGFLAKAVFHVHSLNSFFNASTWVTAILGSIVLLLAVRLVSGRRA